MQPIKEFEFSSLKPELRAKYIDIHNDVVAVLSELTKGLINAEIKDFLDDFLIINIKLLNIPENLEKTIICSNLKKLSNLKNLLKENDILLQNVPVVELKKLDKYSRIASFLKLKKKYELNSVENVLFKDVLLAIFNYDKNRKFLLEFYKDNNFQVCLYCLAQSTSSYTSSKNKKVYLTGNLDHIAAKDSYPFLSISLNNLLPVCAHCNQRKSYNSFDYNPFNIEQKYEFDFSDCLVVDDTQTVVLTSLDKLKIGEKEGNTSDLITKLDFTDLYKNFSGNAENMVERFHKFHSKGYKLQLGSILKDKDLTTEMEYFISEIPLEDKNIVKYPLTKFKIDLYKELKQKYDQNKKK